MPRRALQIAPLLFVSGCCALVYQIAWLREFRLVFGASTAASAAVLAVFIGGLGAGGLLLGRRADRHPSPLLFYAQLETLVAATAAVTPGLLWLVRQAYVASGGTAALGPLLGTLARLLLTALVLLPPTVLMGGTLPAAARAAATSGDAGRRAVALLYGVNTLGAVTGAFVATFFMLEVFGIRATLWLACLVNLLLAMVARQVARTLGAAEAGEQPPPVERPAPAPAGAVLAAAAIVGFVFFLMELVWYRMLGPILGGSVFTFGLILSVALLGIGLGGAAYSILRGDREATPLGFAYTCLLEALAMAVPYALGDRLALFAWVLGPLGELWLLWGQVLAWTLVCSVVVLPAAIVAGYQFPLLIALLGRGREHVGRQVGLTYLWNTVGAIAGSLAGGFGLLPLLSAPGAWRATVWTLVALGLVAMAQVLRARGAARRILAPALLAVAALGLTRAAGPTAAWRHSSIGFGRAGPLPRSGGELEIWLRAQRHQVLWDADGVESSVALVKHYGGLALLINGKNDGSSRIDAPTMVMSGLIGALLHPQPRRSLVIGLGTGATAGWLAAVPTMESVDVVELEPVVLEVARACGPANAGALWNPKVHIAIGDAREALLVSGERYDLIMSEPSNPYRAGVASLFTREYYAGVARRLAAGGLFMQWVQAYEIDARTLRVIYATLSAVFPVVETWQVGRGDLLLVASRQPIAYPAELLRARLLEEPFRTAVAVTWRRLDLEGVLSQHVANPRFARLLAADAALVVNSDDRNHVEFGFARTVGRFELLRIAELRDLARRLGVDRPEIAGGFDWESFENRRVSLYPHEGQAPFIKQAFTPQQRALAAAHSRYAGDDVGAALEAWRGAGREPGDLTELALVAEGLAQKGDDAALPHIGRIRAVEPAEADALLGRLRQRQGHSEEAAAALEAAFTRYRTSPWPLPALMLRALDLVGEVGLQHPELAPRLFAAIREPFAVRVHDDERLNVMRALAVVPALRAHCREAFHPLEPDVPWDREWLVQRFECYRDTRDAALPEAEMELKQYLSAQPPSLGVSLNVKG